MPYCDCHHDTSIVNGVCVVCKRPKRPPPDDERDVFEGLDDEELAAA